MRHLRYVALAGIAMIVLAAPAFAQSTPAAENGRFTFSPTADGVLRLDTRNGSLASCHNRVAGWSCYAVYAVHAVHAFHAFRPPELPMPIT